MTNLAVNVSEQTTLTINVDSSWTTSDFASLMLSLESLYNFYYGLINVKSMMETEVNLNVINKSQRASYHFASTHFNKQKNKYIMMSPVIQRIAIKKNAILTVKSIQYASPGSIDFTGIGKVFETIKQILFYYKPNRKDQLEIDLLQQKKDIGDIEILKGLGYTSLEIRAMMLERDQAVEAVVQLMKTSKITDIKLN